MKAFVHENLFKLDGDIPVVRAIPYGIQHILAMFVANLAPILIVLGGAVLGILVEAFAPAKARRPMVIGLSILATSGAAAVLGLRWVPVLEAPASLGEYIEDPLTIAAQSILMIIDHGRLGHGRPHVRRRRRVRGPALRPPRLGCRRSSRIARATSAPRCSR